MDSFFTRKEEREERIEKAARREKQWELLRMSMEYLKKNEPKWRLRRIEECTMGSISLAKRKTGG